MQAVDERHPCLLYSAPGQTPGFYSFYMDASHHPWEWSLLLPHYFPGLQKTYRHVVSFSNSGHCVTCFFSLCTLFLYAGVCASRWESEGLEVNLRPIPIFFIWVWVVQWSGLAMLWASSNRTFYQFSLWEFFLSLFIKKDTCSEWLFLPCWRSLLPCGWECRL